MNDMGPGFWEVVRLSVDDGELVEECVARTHSRTEALDRICAQGGAEELYVRFDPDELRIDADGSHHIIHVTP